MSSQSTAQAVTINSRGTFWGVPAEGKFYMKRRLLAFLLALVMIVGMIPTSVFADEAEQETLSAPVAEAEAPAPETEAPAEETQPPVTEAPTTEAPETQAPAEAPTETTAAEAPETEAPETEAPTEETEAPLSVMAEAADDVTVYFTVSNQGVLAKTDSDKAAVDLPVTVTDINADGALTFDEALTALHEQYCADGYDYNNTNSSRLWKVVKLWGEEKSSGSTLRTAFYKNGEKFEKMLNWTGASVAEGDKLYAAVMKDSVNSSDTFTWFTETKVDAKVGDPVKLQLMGESEYYTKSGAAGISVGTWEKGSFTALKDATTGTDGYVTLTFDKAGTYIVTANGTVTGYDDSECPIIAPYCVVTVASNGAPDAKVYFTVSQQGVLAKTSKDTAAVELPVTVSDINADGILTFDEALVALHKDYCAEGEDGYKLLNGSVVKLWGKGVTGPIFAKNNVVLTKAVNWKTSTVAEGDKLYAASVKDTVDLSDCLSYFDKTEVTVEAGKEFTLTLKAAGEYWSGSNDKPKAAGGISVGTWEKGSFQAIADKETDSNGTVTLSFAKAGTYIVTASGTVAGVDEEDYDIDCQITAPYCVVTVNGSSTEPAADATVYFTLSNGVLATAVDDQAVAGLPVTVKDLNSDGVLSVDEALIAAHDTYYPEAASGGYACTGGSYGTGYVAKLWGVSGGSYLFYTDGVPLSLGVQASRVKEGCQLYAAILQDTRYYADWYTAFDKTSVSVETGASFELKLSGYYGMAKMGGGDDVLKPVAGASIGTWKSGEFTALEGVTTDSTGKATLRFDKPGTYIVTADGTVTATVASSWDNDGATGYVENDCPIMAPYCVVTVTGSDVTYATVSFNFQEDDGTQSSFAFDEKIPSNLAECYGYTDHVVDGVSALDVLVRAHELYFDDQFTAKSATDFLVVTDANWITRCMGYDTMSLAILVNGKQAAGEDGKGLFVNQAKVVDGDYVTFGMYADTDTYLDRYVWLETADGKPLTGQTFYAGNDYTDTSLDLVVMGNFAAYGDEGGPAAPVEGAQLATMDMKTGKVEAITGKISDEDGKITLEVPKRMANTTWCFVVTGEEMITGLNVFKVGDVLKETDLVEVHLGIGSSESTIQELTLNPTFVHDTMDYTVDPLAFVADEAARRLWVKVEYIPYCTAGFTFHGVTKTFTEEQNRKWVRLDKLVPGAEESVLTLTSSAEGGYDKTYTITVSMDKGQAVIWKTDLTGEPLTIGQNTEHTLTVEAGVTRDVTTDPAINYQWYVNTTNSTEGGKAVDGATEATLTIPSEETGTFYYYAVASSDHLEAATSQIVEVTVKAVPKTITPVSDYVYTIQDANTNAKAFGGVTYVVESGTTMKLSAVDENGEETPVTWKVSSSWGGKLDTETGIYTVTSNSYTYVTAVSALDPTVTSGEKVIDVKFYKLTENEKTVKLSADGQSNVTAALYAAIPNGYAIWDVKIPEGVAEINSKLSEKKNSLNMYARRPGKIDVTLTIDCGPADAPKLTDTATITITGVAVENDQGGLGKAYLEMTSETPAPTMQLKALTETGRTVAAWSSADEKIATVDENGVVTAHAVGSVIITATDDNGTKGGIKVIVSDAQNPTFENLALFGITSSTFKYDVNTKDYTGIKLTSYSTKILTIKSDTLFDDKKLDCVATYTNEDGEAVSVKIPSATQTQLPGFPFGVTTVTLTLSDKADPEIKSTYTLEVTRPRDTTKTLGANGWGGTKVSLYDAKGEALSSTLYLDKAEGYLFQASETGAKNSTYTWANNKYYYRAFMQNGRPDFSALLKGNTDYVHVRYSTDDGATWKELAQGGGQTDAIAFPEATEEANAEVKVTVQVVTDQAYFNAGNAYPEMTSSKEKLLIPNESGSVTVDGVKYEQVGTTYTFWVEQLPQVEQPRILTAIADTTDGDWYPTFDSETFSYRISLPTDAAEYPTLTFTIGEGCTVKLGTKALTADEEGNYTVKLTSSEQKVNVTLGDLTQAYTFAAPKRVKNGADKLVDYLCINSQYSNGASQAYGLYGESMLSGTLKSLGNFGGYATFYFEDGLKDDPTNKYGVDFYVDGNAFKDTTTGTGLGSMEPGQVWVSEDGSTWYALAGSQHYTNAIWNYTVTYTKNGAGLHWSDNYGNSDTSVPNRTFQWPRSDIYYLNDLADSDTITLSGILIPSVKGIVGPDDFSTYSSGAKFGYVDVMVNGTDNPYGYNDDYSLKSSGFDLAWAVDASGNPVNVSGKSFHYVKVVTASNIVAGQANEKSTEVSKVYRATSTGASVGQTPAPTAITFSGNGINYTLTPEAGKQIYELNLHMKAASISVSGGAENIYVNDQRVASDTASKAIEITKDKTLVRVIVQSGDMEPTIYLLKLSCDITDEVAANADTTLIGGKSMKLTAVDNATGKIIPASSITWTLADPDDAAYVTVNPNGTVKSYVVASKHNVTFLGTLKNGYTGFVTHTVTIYPPVSLVEIYNDETNVTGSTLYLDTGKDTELDLTAKLYPTDAKEGITWKSSNTKVLTVEDGTVKYVAGTGTVTITATASDGSKKSASVKIQVGTLAQSVTITEPANTTLRSGKSLTLKATTEPVKPTVAGVTFRLVNASDSVYAAVAANGKVTAKTVNEPHAVQVIAVSKDGQATSEPITLTILPKNDQSLILKSGEDYVTKATLIRNIGKTVELKAYTLDVSGEVPTEVAADVTWKSSSEKVAIVTEDGIVTCNAKGKATISALVDGKVQATVTVNVTSLVESLTIGSKTGSFFVSSGKKLNLTATVAPATAANKAVTWAITEGGEYAKISSSGVVTANKNLTGVKTITVTATAKDGSGITAEQKIAVKPLSYGVEIKRPNSSENTTLVWDMAADGNDTLKLSAYVYPLTAQQSVTWKSSSTKVAAIDETGKITFLKAGSVTITATANDGSGKKASFKIQVVKLMKSLELNDASVAGGKSVTLKPVIGPADTTNKKLTWSVSENEYGIKINGSGKLSTKAVKEPVTVTVTAIAQDGSGVKATCKVTVYPATTKVVISAKDGELPAFIQEDTTLELTASSLPGNTAGVYTWKSSNVKVATVDENGVVTAIKAGKVKITCTAADGTNKSASVTVKVVEATETPGQM